MKTTTTLKTLTLAAAAGVMTLGINAPALNAYSDWDAPAGTTNLADCYPHQYANVNVGTGSFGSSLYISNNTHVLGTGDAMLGYAANAYLEITTSGSFVMDGDITIGATYDAQVRVWDDGMLDGNQINVGTLGTMGEVVVGDSGAVVFAGSLRIGNTGSVGVEADGKCYVNNSLFIEPTGSLYIESGGKLDANAAEFGFGLNLNGIYGITVARSDGITLSLGSTLAIVANEEYGSGKVFRLITGFSVSSYHWGDTVVASDTGQVFDIIYNNGGPGVEIMATSQVIPEPSTYALLGGVGAVALAVLKRRRRKG